MPVFGISVIMALKGKAVNECNIWRHFGRVRQTLHAIAARRRLFTGKGMKKNLNAI